MSGENINFTSIIDWAKNKIPECLLAEYTWRETHPPKTFYDNRNEKFGILLNTNRFIYMSGPTLYQHLLVLPSIYIIYLAVYFHATLTDSLYWNLISFGVGSEERPHLVWLRNVYLIHQAGEVLPTVLPLSIIKKSSWVQSECCYVTNDMIYDTVSSPVCTHDITNTTVIKPYCSSTCIMTQFMSEDSQSPTGSINPCSAMGDNFLSCTRVVSLLPWQAGRLRSWLWLWDGIKRSSLSKSTNNTSQEMMPSWELGGIKPNYFTYTSHSNII